MTAPMTPRDPFTDEDVRKAKDAYNYATRSVLFTHTDGIKAALLAGTERLRAQGTWNEAIEAAAKVSQNSGFVSSHRIARAIRALKRPEAP